MKGIINIHEILKMLPHRYPFILIDRVLEIELGKSIVAIKNVTMDEPFFTGHFPEQPVMPGVLIVEAMAQAGALLAYKSSNVTARSGTLFYFAAIEKCRFRRVVEPGDQLRIEVKVLRSKLDMWKLEGAAYVEGQLACSGEFMSIAKNNNKV